MHHKFHDRVINSTTDSWGEALNAGFSDSDMDPQVSDACEGTFYKLINELNEAVLIIGEDGRILYVNQTTATYYGYSCKEFIGKPVGVLADPEFADAAAVDDFLAKAIHRLPLRFEFRGRHRNGTTFPLEVNLSKGQYFEKPALIIVARDIRHRKEAEAALHESEKRFRTLLQQIPTVAVQGCDKNGVVHYWNTASEKLFGFQENEAVGKKLFDLICPSVTRLEVENKVRQMIETGKPAASCETVLMRKDGARVSVFSTHALVQFPGKPFELYHIGVDLTERKRAEKALIHAKEAAEEANKAKSTFLATMSHEIRTPLYSVTGMSSLLLKTKLTAAQKEMAKTIAFGADSLLALISDVLDYSKIEAGKIEIEQEPFHLCSILTDTLQLVLGQAMEKQLELSYFIDPNAPEILIGDALRLRQILLNLLANAIKFTQKGEISVSAEANEIDGDLWEITFTVTDSGIGIPESSLPRLFQPFVQVDSSTTRNFGGSGLGLAISRKLVELMGGVIMASSLPGRGSSFQFTIRAAAKPNSHRVFVSGDHSKITNRRVLIVEKNDTTRRLLTAVTKTWGMHPRSVSCQTELIKKRIQPDDFDLLITRLHLLHELQQKPARPRVVLLTSSLDEITDASNAGYEGILTQPIQPERLHHLIHAALNLNPPAQKNSPVPGSPANKPAVIRILCAEDNKINQKVTKLILKKMGYPCDCVDNGQLALEALQKNEYELILMDIQMPVMDGLTCSKEIIEKYGPKRPPIIALTANAMLGDREECLKAGIDSYLSKPLQPAALQMEIERFFPR